jgi:hypothetical protein
MELKLNKNGKVLEQKLIEGSPDITAVDFKQATSFFAILPELPVKIGDTWTIEDSINSFPGGAGISKTPAATKFNVEGKEIFEGNECLKISYTQDLISTGNKAEGAEGITGAGKLQGKGIYYYDLKKGVLALNTVSAETAADVKTTGQEKALSFTAKMKMEMRLVK